MRVLVKYAMAVLFVALISENGVLGQDSTRSAQLQNFDYEEWMKDVPMPSHTIFSIFCIDCSYCRWSRAIRDCKLGKPHYKISDPHHQEMQVHAEVLAQFQLWHTILCFRMYS